MKGFAEQLIKTFTGPEQLEDDYLLIKFLEFDEEMIYQERLLEWTEPS